MYRFMSRAVLADGQDQFTAALRDGARHVRLEVHVRKLWVIRAVPQTAHAFEAHAGIQEASDDRAVPPVAEIPTGAVRQQKPDHLVVLEHGYRRFRNLGRLHRGHG
jgi:hypothetical protein